MPLACSLVAPCQPGAALRKPILSLLSTLLVRTGLDEALRTELRWWGASGDNRWRGWVGSRLGGDRNGPARQFGRRPRQPHLSQRRRRGVAYAGSCLGECRNGDHPGVMLVGDQRAGAGALRRWTPGQVPVRALRIMMPGVAVGPGLSWQRRGVVQARRVHMRERRRPAGRDQRYDERHMCDTPKHRVYPDEGPSRCQLIFPGESGQVDYAAHVTFRTCRLSNALGLRYPSDECSRYGL